ncbi:MAG TPA: ABC transporter ATP-binding protein [Patescibacteria group bacterium]|nr:ABC transporter ATP-binding protein [Patescibacteria group bacterium]
MGSGMMGSMRMFRQDASVTKEHIQPGTTGRILKFAAPYTWPLLFFLLLVVANAGLVIINPLLYREIINRGILERHVRLIIQLAALAGAVSLLEAGVGLWQSYLSARIGNAIVLAMRTKLFEHIQGMPLAFFTRTQTGALVSRLNNDVGGAQSAFTDVLSNVIGNIVSVALILAAMFALSWQLTLASLIVLPLMIWPARTLGRKLRTITRERYDLTAAMNTVMVERFNVAGAQLAKLFGRRDEDRKVFETKAARVSDIGVKRAIYGRFFFTAMALMSSFATVLIFGWGGVLAVERTLDVGTLVALVSYLNRLYGPLTALSNIQVSVMTALVSFERVFEVLDLPPMIREKPNAAVIAPGPATIRFEHVYFRYPAAAEVSLASLESVAAPDEAPSGTVLRDVSFTVSPGEMVALVGPSGAGKTTIAQLAARLYDPQEGAVRINGVDLREATLDSVHARIGIVTQETYLFHDSIRANLLYAKPGASEGELRQALGAAHILPLVESLPAGLETMVGERGYRFSGGEKQRLSIARLLLKAPDIVILDEATAHLDSESEAAIREALKAALAGRTSLVIAHRLSTILHADQILVIDRGEIVECGTHAALVERGGLYAELYHRQFAGREMTPQS